MSDPGLPEWAIGLLLAFVTVTTSLGLALLLNVGPVALDRGWGAAGAWAIGAWTVEAVVPMLKDAVGDARGDE